MESDVARRTVLASLAGAGLLAAGASAAPAQTPPAPPRPPMTLPPAWAAAPSLPLWPSGQPDRDAFRPQPLPDPWPPVFLRNTLDPQLHVFTPRISNGRALLVIPGGAYQFVSIGNEGVDVAAQAGALGYTVFVLSYRLPSEGWTHGSDVPLQDAQRAVRVLRAGAGRFGIDPDRIAVVGFSAGGHLAASLATGFEEAIYAPADEADRLSARPAAAALVYPVITMRQQETHAQSRLNLLGPSPSQALIERRSPERQVTAATPPLFLVHAFDDPAVPVENSLMMLAAARAAHRPVEAHLFQEGGHAFGVGLPGTPTSEWIPLLHLWLQRTLA